MLDIEVAGAVAPGAKIAVYFTPNTDQGFIDAITTAVHDTTNKPSVISISWGGPESSWTQQSLTALDAACQSAAALGVTITVAAGDNGSSDGGTGNNVDFPASSPHVLACGGTTLEASGATITSEVVWNETAANEGATGGGVSTVFPLPTWQAGANAPIPPPTTPRARCSRRRRRRGSDHRLHHPRRWPDDGDRRHQRRRSAVGRADRGRQPAARPEVWIDGGLHPPDALRGEGRIGLPRHHQGNNGAYSAGPGWDACTGLGSPIAAKLIPLLAPAAASASHQPGQEGSHKERHKEDRKEINQIETAL